MEILTKEWAKEYEQLRFIHCLKEYDSQNESYKEINRKSEIDFYKDVESDEELAKLVLKTNIVNELYKAQKDRFKKVINTFPKSITSQMKHINTLVFGYACKEDKAVLAHYAKKLLVDVERIVKISNNNTEIAQYYLNNNFMLDDLVGELVFKEYFIDKDYFFDIGENKICIENYEIIEREDFKINKWDKDNPLTLWTAVYSAEIHYISTQHYELHLLLVDGDKYANEKFWYFTIKGTNVKKCN